MARERRRDNERKTINEKRNILKNADISIRNNSIAKIVLKSRIGGGSLYILENNGDIEDMPFNELNDIFKRHRKMFENFKVYETTIAGRPFKLETGKMAQLANAAVLA